MTNIVENSLLEAAPVDETTGNEDAVVEIESRLHWAISELQDKTDELRQIKRERQVVQELTAGLLTLTTEEDLAKRLLSDLRTLVHADNGSVMLTDEEGDKMEIVADMGLPDEVRKLKVPIGEGISGLVMSSGEPMLLRGLIQNRSTQQRDVSCSLVVPIRCRGESLGVVNLNQTDSRVSFRDNDLQIVATVVSTFSAMFDAVRQQRHSKGQLVATIQALAKAIEAKDPYTKGHCERLATYATGMASMLDLDAKLIDSIEMGATLHDVGKIGVPEHILRKPDKLTKDEYDLIKQHPVVGAEIIRPVGLPKATIDAVLYHHERLDGKGYPEGIAGDEIPFTARIVAVADAFDAMTITRPYRSALPVKDAFDEVKRCSGTQFDPEIVSVFLEYCDQEEIGSKLVGIESARNTPRRIDSAAVDEAVAPWEAIEKKVG